MSRIEFSELSFAPCQGNLDSGIRQIFAGGILNPGNSVKGIRNPTNDCNHGNHTNTAIRNPVPVIRNPQRGIQKTGVTHYSLEQTRRSTAWTNGNQKSGLVFKTFVQEWRLLYKSVPFNKNRLRKPETGIKDGLKIEMEQEFPFGIFRQKKTGLPFQIFRWDEPILGDPGADSRDDTMFVVKSSRSYSKLSPRTLYRPDYLPLGLRG